MGVAENKALVVRFYEEVWGRVDLAFVHEVCADSGSRWLPPRHLPPSSKPDRSWRTK